MNRYNEALIFITADKGVPNHGLTEDGSGGEPARIKWRHVSINTMTKVSNEGQEMQALLEKY